MSEGSGNEGRGGTHTALRRTDRTRLEPHFDLYTEPACSGYNQTGNYVTCGDRRGDRTLRTTYCTGMYGGNRRGVRYANNPPHVGNPPSVTRYGWTMRQP